MSELLNSELCGLGADMITLPIIMGIEEEMGEYAFLVNSAVKCIYEVMNEIDGGDMRLAGINNFLKYYNPYRNIKIRIGMGSRCISDFFQPLQILFR